MFRKPTLFVLVIICVFALAASRPVAAQTTKASFKVRIDDISGMAASSVKYIGVFSDILPTAKAGGVYRQHACADEAAAYWRSDSGLMPQPVEYLSQHCGHG